MVEIGEPSAIWDIGTASEISESDSQLLDSAIAKRRGPGRPFKPGEVANPYGRAGNPDKKTAVSELRRLADRRATTLARALVNQAERGNVRAWVAMADRAYGVPAQKLVISREDDPLMAWLAAVAPGAELPALPAGGVSRETPIAPEPTDQNT